MSPHDDDPADATFALIDHARAAGLTLRSERSGVTVRPADRLDPDLERSLSNAHDAIRSALRAERAAKDAIQRARPVYPAPAGASNAGMNSNSREPEKALPSRFGACSE
jgi:hypothetical protein